MLKVKDICSHVRSKNAGPFWITVDVFFDSDATYQRYCNEAAFGAPAFARLYGVDPSHVKRFCVDRLRMIKISYPRPNPQGWMHERDMHGGQQYVRLLDVGVEPPD
jgi:Domain of unknown function (DUF4387)